MDSRPLFVHSGTQDDSCKASLIVALGIRDYVDVKIPSFFNKTLRIRNNLVYRRSGVSFAEGKLKIRRDGPWQKICGLQPKRGEIVLRLNNEGDNSIRT